MLNVYASVHILYSTNLMLHRQEKLKAEAQIGLFKRKYQYVLIEQSVGLLDLPTALFRVYQSHFTK